MNCVRCGKALRPGQDRCSSCGQYVDLPASELYARLETQVEASSRSNLLRGLLIGLGFLLFFLLLEKITDLFTHEIYGMGAGLLVAAAYIGFNLWQVVRKFLM